MQRIPNITFSHDYHKLPDKINGKLATLLFVYQLEIDCQTKALIEYDTKIRNGNKSNYILGNGIYLLLLFECKGTVFTTLRSYSAGKERYYRRKVNESFKVVIGYG